MYPTAELSNALNGLDDVMSPFNKDNQGTRECTYVLHHFDTQKASSSREPWTAAQTEVFFLRTSNEKTMGVLFTSLYGRSLSMNLAAVGLIPNLGNQRSLLRPLDFEASRSIVSTVHQRTQYLEGASTRMCTHTIRGTVRQTHLCDMSGIIM